MWPAEPDQGLKRQAAVHTVVRRGLFWAPLAITPFTAGGRLTHVPNTSPGYEVACFASNLQLNPRYRLPSQHWIATAVLFERLIGQAEWTVIRGPRRFATFQRRECTQERFGKGDACCELQEASVVRL